MYFGIRDVGQIASHAVWTPSVLQLLLCSKPPSWSLHSSTVSYYSSWKGTRRLPLTPSHNKTDIVFLVVSISGLVRVVVVVVVVVVVDLCVLGPVLPPSRCCYWTDVRRQSLPHIPSSYNSKDTNAQAHVREQVILLLSAISPHFTSSQTRPAHQQAP